LFELPATAFNNRVCDAEVLELTKVAAPCACLIIEIKIDRSRHTAQTHNVKCSLHA